MQTLPSRAWAYRFVLRHPAGSKQFVRHKLSFRDRQHRICDIPAKRMRHNHERMQEGEKQETKGGAASKSPAKKG